MSVVSTFVDRVAALISTVNALGGDLILALANDFIFALRPATWVGPLQPIFSNHRCAVLALEFVGLGALTREL